MAKNLYNLTEVTTVNNSDLLHVNQGSVSSDKKVTKQNLLKEVNSSISSINNSLTQRLTDISSQFTWNTSLSAVNKGVIAYYDPYNHSVRGSFYINVSSSFASTAHILVAPSGYRPSSNSAWIGVLSTTSKDTNFYYGSILTDGKFTQSLTSVCMGAYGQFEYKI